MNTTTKYAHLALLRKYEIQNLVSCANVVQKGIKKP